MEIFELQNLIARNECPKFLLFVGEDYALANLYTESIAKRYSCPKISLENMQTVLSESRGNALFNEKRLFVLKYPKDLVSKEEFWNNIEEDIGENILIVMFAEIDKRTKFYNRYKDRVVNFEPQEEKTYLSMISPLIKFSKNNLVELSKICKNNYGKTLSEIDKVKQYSVKNGITEDAAFTHLVKSGIIYTGNKEVIFDFIDKVMEASKDMYKYYSILKLQGESNMKLISLLYTAFRNQFMVQTVNNPTQQSTGLAPFIISNCIRRKGIYKNSDLRRGMGLLRELEQGVKAGKFDEYITIDYFLAELLL